MTDTSPAETRLSKLEHVCKAIRDFGRRMEGIDGRDLEAMIAAVRQPGVADPMLDRAERLEAERIREGQARVLRSAQRLRDQAAELWPGDAGPVREIVAD